MARDGRQLPFHRLVNDSGQIRSRVSELNFAHIDLDMPPVVIYERARFWREHWAFPCKFWGALQFHE